MASEKNKQFATYERLRLVRAKEDAEKISYITRTFLKKITESLPQYVFWKDVNSVYLGCNKNYANLLGLNSPEDIVGKTDNNLNWQPIGHTTNIFQQGDKDTIAGHPITNQEEVLALPDGRTLVTLVSKLPIVDDSGQILGIVGYFTNITDIKQKEKELLMAKREAESANEAKASFIANMSHDIRTPLTGMLGMADIIAKHTHDEKTKAASDNLSTAGKALLVLLNEVIELANLESGDLPVYDIKFDIKEVLNSILELEKPSADLKGLDFTININKAMPHNLIGDNKRIHRILLNLVGNAIKFTKAGRVAVFVDFSVKDKREVLLKLQVEDSGVGIPMKAQQIIFSKFDRLDPAYHGKNQGSGLGLSIVKKFITDLDGEICLDSKEGVGSTFTCIIPVKQSLLEEPNPQSSGVNEFETCTTSNTKEFDPGNTELNFKKKPHVLLVEDDHMAKMVAIHLLDELGCMIDHAATGEEALQFFREKNYDLIFMDVGLPDNSGCDVTRDIRTQEKLTKKSRTPIVALTAHVDQSKKEECVTAGMDETLTKPLFRNSAKNILMRFVTTDENSTKQDNTAQKPASSVDTPDNLPTIDLELGQQLMEENLDLTFDTLEFLIGTLPKIKEILKESYDKKDWKGLQFEAHKLYGSLCYCGTPRLSAAVKLLEETPLSEKYSNVSAQINNVLLEIDTLMAAYKNL